jgi:hypothetical protein
MKTEKTLELERNIWGATHNQGTFGCFEVTIGWFGRERVDYMTYNTTGEFRCYEIKVSRADFRSKSHNSFVGHYNYYVMTPELWEEVKAEIPPHIGCYVGGKQVKKPKRQPLGADESVLKDSLIRSMCREIQKQMASGSPTYVDILKREAAEERGMAKYYRDNLNRTMGEVRMRYGVAWDAAPVIYDKDGEEI